MIKVKVNNEYKDVVKIFCGGTLQKEITKVWSREAQEYVYESSVEYTGTLPIAINANREALLDYRIYGDDGGVGERTENLWDRGVPQYVYAMDYKKYNPNNAIALEAGTYTLSSDGALPIIQAFSEDHTQLNVRDTITYMSNYYLMWGEMAIGPTAAIIRETTITILFDCILTFAVSGNYGTYLMLTEGSTAPTSYIPYGYKLPMTVSGNTAQTVPIYISENQLEEDEYVDYGSGKIYRMSGGTLTPTDPPVPLPEIPTADGTTIIDYDGEPKPSQMYVKYRR